VVNLMGKVAEDVAKVVGKTQDEAMVMLIRFEFLFFFC
jgi:hypothetical protein